MLKEFYDMKEEIKNSNNWWTIYKTMLSYCLESVEKIWKVKIQNQWELKTEK